VDIEARVEEDRKAGLALEGAERQDLSTPFRKHVARFRHIEAGAPIDIRDVEDLASFSRWITGANGTNPPARMIPMK